MRLLPGQFPHKGFPVQVVRVGEGDLAVDDSGGRCSTLLSRLHVAALPVSCPSHTTGAVVRRGNRERKGEVGNRGRAAHTLFPIVLLQLIRLRRGAVPRASIWLPFA